ncbi:unnamed protein product, partial [Laminaria digitata]
WLDRRKPEPASPHFMRNAPAQSRPAAAHPAAAAATGRLGGRPVGAVALGAPGAPVGDGRGGRDTVGEVMSPRAEAAKEAKRKAFAADRARMQARIASSRGGVSSSSGAAAAATAAATTASSQQQQQQGTFQKQPRGFDSAAAPLSSSENPATGLSTPFSAAVSDGRSRISPKNANLVGGGGAFSS